MAATMQIFMDTGGTDNTPGSEDRVDAIGIRFKSNDNITIDTADPIAVPAAGTNYSYWKAIYLKMTASDSTKVNGTEFYSDGTITFGTGLTLMVGDETPEKNSGSDAGYEVATGTSGTTGDEMVAAVADLTGSTSAADLVTGSPLTVSISEASNQMDATNETSDYVYLQVNVATTALAGLSASETLTFRYDEAPV